MSQPLPLIVTVSFSTTISKNQHCTFPSLMDKPASFAKIFRTFCHDSNLEIFGFCWLLLCVTSISNSAFAENVRKVQKANIDYIDPTIGNVGQLLETTRPTVHLPNQIMRFTTRRKDYMDHLISSFPLNIVSDILKHGELIKHGE